MVKRIKKFLVPAIVSLVAIATVAALVVVLRTSEIVLKVEGEAQTLKVREDTVGKVLESQNIHLGEHDVVMPAADTKVIDGLEISVSYGRELELTIDGQKRTVWTTARTVEDALSMLNIGDADAKVSVSRSTGIGREGLNFDVQLAKDVTVSAAGNTTKVRAAGTVQDVLDAQGIKPDADDIVEPAATTQLTDNLAISFVQVDIKTTTKDKEIDFGKKEVTSATLAKGTEKVTTKGVKGSATETYEEVYHDGKLVSSTLKDTTVTKAPVDQVTTVGTKEVAVANATSSSAASSSSASSNNLTPATGSTCQASYYWQGQITATGEQFNPNALTAAHKTLPFGTQVKVTNPSTGKSVIVRINDRGPYIAGRCLDLSRAAMETIGGTAAGVITVNYEVVS